VHDVGAILWRGLGSELGGVQFFEAKEFRVETFEVKIGCYPGVYEYDGAGWSLEKSARLSLLLVLPAVV